MRILMATAAKLMCKLLLEVAARVTFFTNDAAMPATQREVGQIMVERAARDSSPAFSIVTLRARISKAAAMRVLMARRAIGKLQPGVLHEGCTRFIAHLLACCLFEVTLRTRNTSVLAREHKLRALVRKFCRGLPCSEVVATFTCGAKLPAMFISMT